MRGVGERLGFPPDGGSACREMAENEVLLFALKSKPELPGTGPGDCQV